MPLDRLLLETDSPDGRPQLSGDEAAGLRPVPAPSHALGSDPDIASEGSQAGGSAGRAQAARSASHQLGMRGHDQEANADNAGPSAAGERDPRSKAEQLNHPANIRCKTCEAVMQSTDWINSASVLLQLMFIFLGHAGLVMRMTSGLAMNVKPQVSAESWMPSLCQGAHLLCTSGGCRLSLK